MELRSLIYQTAAELPAIGDLEEALRWGQPAYLTSQTKTGTTIRLGVPKSGGFALFVHCQTRLLEEFRSIYGAEFRFDGNRAVLFAHRADIKPTHLRSLIANALTYHLKSP